MFKTKRTVTDIVSAVAVLAAITFLALSVIPAADGSRSYSPKFTWITVSALIISVLLVLYRLRSVIIARLKRKSLFDTKTGLLEEFMGRLKFCYSYDDFYNIIGDVLEVKGDCSVIFLNRSKKYVLYNSPDRLTSSKTTIETLEMSYDENWKDGFYLMGGNYGVVADYKKSRGFFMVCQGLHLYVFCQYTQLFDPEIYKELFDEYKGFRKRTSTISDLSEIASLSQEWQQLATTQRSFLPHTMPKIDHLELAAYFRPLINVSGDYYSVLPISKSKTLLMLGDVSGKGLAAALVMGLVMNTVKILEDKDDLPGMIKAVDKAIKGMHLQDKYTVLFIGIVDTSKMTIRYINASMSDPLIITKSPSGYRIKPLTSNCSVVGIIDVPDVEPDEAKLFRGDVIFMSSDGVSEVMDDQGVELGDTELYHNTITKSAVKHPEEFVDDVVNLVMSYNGNKKLHDDVTMMVAKVVE